MPEVLAGQMRANVAMQQRLGIPTRTVEPHEIGRLVPGAVTDDLAVGAYEPESGYADPSGTAAGFLAAARANGARLVQGSRVTGIALDGDTVVGVDTGRGRIAAPAVAVAVGAWAADLVRTAGVDLPVQAWRHETAYFGLPSGHGPDFPIVIDEVNGAYFRPEGHDMMLVGLEGRNEVGGSPDRPFAAAGPAAIEDMVQRVCARVPWMTEGTFRTAHGGQDGITPDQRPILGRGGPEGLYLASGFSGTGFKTAPAIGACLAELILDGRTSTSDISAYGLDRFAAGRPLVGEHPYGVLWR
jgi:sarcosine oxidase subunit beta